MIRYGVLEQMKYGLGPGESWDSDLTTYMSGLSTPLSLNQKTLLNSFITSLKSGMGITNLSDAFDIMYIFAGETEESALRNLVKRSHDATNINSTTFTQYEGFQGNGTSQYLNTNYNPSTNGVNYTDSSAGFGIYFRTPRAAANLYGGGCIQVGSTTSCAFYPFRTNSIRYYINEIVPSAYSVYTICGMSHTFRTSLTTKRAGRNKALGSNAAVTSAGKPDASIFLLAINNQGNPGRYESSQMSFAYAGRSLEQTDINALYDSFEAYMNARNKGFLYFSYPSILTDGSTVGWYVSDASSTTMYFSQDTSVYAWNDILGSGHDLIQATGSKQPKWTSDGVLFDGVDDYLKTAAFSFGQPAFVYMVVKPITETSNDIYWDTAVGRYLQRGSGNTRLSGTVNLTALDGGLPAGAWAISRVLLNGTSSKIQVNTSTATIGDGGTSTPTLFSLGALTTGSTPSNIQVKEVILRNVADNATDEAAIYNYLATKYSIT